MEKQTWKPDGGFFRPAPPGLGKEELEERARRENSASHGISLVMSNGPRPSEEAVALMQKYVDGESTLEEVLAETLKLHGIAIPPNPRKTRPLGNLTRMGFTGRKSYRGPFLKIRALRRRGIPTLLARLLGLAGM